VKALELSPNILSASLGAITLAIIWMLVPKSGGDQMNARELAVQQDLRWVNATTYSRSGLNPCRLTTAPTASSFAITSL